MASLAFPSRLPVPALLQVQIEAAARSFLEPAGDTAAVDFARPAGEAALAAPDSVSWRVFKNFVALYVGGVAAVILELAEPGVRAGVMEHSGFREDPVRRMRRTGLAAMTSVYGARSRAEAMIAGVVRMHEKVAGVDAAGRAYRANDPELLRWVHATAVFGFGQAYDRYVRPFAPGEFDRLFQEATPAGRLYGVPDPVRSTAELQSVFAAMRGRLEPSPDLFEFLAIMRTAPVLPRPLRRVQRLLVRAAVEITPGWARSRLGLGARFGLRPWQRPLARQLGALADRILVRSSPPVQACLRLGLHEDWLFRA
jgi:uncharacterized protein (DUF2236 family)